ncbi:DNA alkylation repair enzyme [Thioploca ingrica]|uniref:DNA alkylation repair enzyme n=1 Tax=Thioploca ingrica TaxID=40754 RepID=A0A090AQ97_9GAMM|nr:DNA alkylation repair enzyme [Thioploca ingrica]
MLELDKLQQQLQQLADPKQQAILQRFFKTAPGEYGEGDIFLGIKVPILRKIAKQYKGLSLTDIQILLQNSIHEYRFIALVILIYQYTQADSHRRQEIIYFYLNHTRYINNWDLVDISAPQLLGDYLLTRSKEVLYQLALSEQWWERRISILATFCFIKHHDFADTLQLATILLQDQHDLIHKSVGWMLREVGKRNIAVEKTFLQRHYQQMPRTMLRYAIEKFSNETRQFYLKK